MRAPYLEPSLPVEARVRDLLPRMTLEEKVRQLNMLHSATVFLDKEKQIWKQDVIDELIDAKGLGFMQHPQQTKESNPRLSNELQRAVLERSRLKIPMVWVTETLHGFLAAGATVFPQSIALASTFNPGLLKEVASAIGLEAGSSGAHLSCAPDLDVAQDPRWGRVEETYGEDPHLIGEMGSAYISGIQGDPDAIDRKHIGCTVKHFTAHGAPQGGLNVAPVPCGERQLRESYLKPFKKCIEKNRPLAVMPAYSEFDGIPIHQNEFLLTTLLREEMGFEGIVISDYEGMEFLQRLHGTAGSYEDAGKACLLAGCDVEAPRIRCFGEKFIEMIRTGEVPEAYVDRAVERVLRIKFRLGLFENPYVEEGNAPIVVNCRKHIDLALRAGYESVVLLKNEGGLLPIKETVKSLAVIGPNADVAQLGDYCVGKKSAVTPLAGIKARACGKVAITYSKGCDLTAHDVSGIFEAVEAAGKADLALVFVGGASDVRAGIGWGEEDKNAVSTCGEGYDRSELGLPGVQQQLVEAVVGTGTPTAVILQNGRPLAIPWINEHVPAIVEMWYAGEQLGKVIAGILFGDVNPSGRLPISFPKEAGQLPVFYNYKPSARGRVYQRPGSPDKPGRDYVFSDPAALYEFGHGLSYTTFGYANLTVAPDPVPSGEVAVVSVTVKNTGNRAGYESVLLYVRDVISSVTTPVRALKGFQKIWIEPGEEKTVMFPLGFDALSLVNGEMKEVVEPGRFEVYVGGLSASFDVL